MEMNENNNKKIENTTVGKNMRYYVFLPSSQVAMQLYQVLTQKGLDVSIIPTPMEADHCCGVCVSYIDASYTDKIKEIVKEEGIAVDGYWKREIQDDPNRFKFC